MDFLDTLKRKGDTMKKYLYSKDGKTWERRQAAEVKENDPGDICDFDFTIPELDFDINLDFDLDFSFLNDIEI